MHMLFQWTAFSFTAHSADVSMHCHAATACRTLQRLSAENHFGALPHVCMHNGQATSFLTLRCIAKILHVGVHTSIT